MTNENEIFEVIPNGDRYQVVLMADEFYRDKQGNLLKRRVPVRFYETFPSPVEAHACAVRWNIEDGRARVGGAS